MARKFALLDIDAVHPFGVFTEKLLATGTTSPWYGSIGGTEGLVEAVVLLGAISEAIGVG